MKRKNQNEPWGIQHILDRCVASDTGCLIWQGAKSPTGYGAVRINAKTTRPHRAAYQFARGQFVPSNLDICHTCDNRLCCNPAHLFVGTRKDNMRDCSAKGRVKVPGLSGDKCPASKLTSEKVLAIRADKRSQRAIARDYGVDKGTIAHIQLRKTWRSI